ncbi:two-component system sensor histidine kinase CreC [Luteimonas aestuarii]|uniref:histidine kinase n=1 Tax=Luteimonas aestuarii TaxID=453837 RepID=A0A4R5U4Q6_9GAMM|nr:two-component system sensor histidine kinase CreC [Luteimonas aestuarii]TDK28740.1 two-component system sensor histidine kinase CreC [Luteimonas aestuarii]
MKIGLRILLGYFVIVAIAGILLLRVFVQEVKPGVRQAMEDTLADTANVLAELATDDMLAGRIADGRFARRIDALRHRDLGAHIWDVRKRRVSYRVTITDAAGIVVYDSAGLDMGRDNSRWNDVYLTLRGQYGARSTRSDPDDEDSTVMHVAAPILDGDRLIGVLTVAKPNSATQPFIARSERTVRRWGLVLLGAALGIGLLASWWLSRQLGGLQRYARAVTAGERATLPDAAGEFADLGRALETMRDRLEGKQYVEGYVHSLTHELKAPLTAIRGAAELLSEPSLPEADRVRFAAHVDGQSERMAQTIDKLLALAAVESRQRIEQPEAIDVGTLLADVCLQFALRAEQQGVSLQPPREPPAAIVRGDGFLLRQLFANLLDNALAHAPAGSRVRWSLVRAGAHVVVEIGDEGPGVPEYALGRVFERFYSLPRPGGGSRSSGLGLPFVAEVAELHGGRASLANRDEGGAIARVELPLAD